MEYNDYWDFLAQMTREMWKLMNDISSYSYVLKEEEYRPSLADDERRELLFRLDSRQHRMIRILNRMDDISHYSSIETLDRQDCVPVNQLCRELIGEQDSDIVFRTDLPDDFKLTTSEDSLRQLLTMLLEQAVARVQINRRELGKDSIVLDVSGSSSKEKLVFSIKDSGDPLTSQEAISAFFLPHKEKGRELMMRVDLHICSLIVKLLGGVIFIDPDFKSGRCVIFELHKGSDPLCKTAQGV